MIIKQFEKPRGARNRLQRAGDAAEEQMAHYLNRAFSADQDVFVANGLRIEDPNQPEQNGSSGVCQIDHLVVHRWGMFIIESKSVSGKVNVRNDGSGGDEWIRVNGRKKQGMPSPLQQANRQANFLRAYLQSHKRRLLSRQPFGLRSIAKVATGTDQRTFSRAPIQRIVAVSDNGEVERINDWKEPEGKFRSFVKKADLVCDTITDEIKAHRRISNDDYGMWSMSVDEALAVAEFLALGSSNRKPADGGEHRHEQQLQPKNNSLCNNIKLPPPPPAPNTNAACKHCGSADLTGKWGPYGYYWMCLECRQNTSMSSACSKCEASSLPQGQARVRKNKRNYFRDCEQCGTSEFIWSEPQPSFRNKQTRKV